MLTARAEREGLVGLPSEAAKEMTRFPKGWDEARVRRVLEHYDSQTPEEAVAEDEAALEEDETQATIIVPKELVPEVDALIARHRRLHPSSGEGPGSPRPKSKP